MLCKVVEVCVTRGKDVPEVWFPLRLTAIALATSKGCSEFGSRDKSLITFWVFLGWAEGWSESRVRAIASARLIFPDEAGSAKISGGSTQPEFPSALSLFLDLAADSSHHTSPC